MTIGPTVHLIYPHGQRISCPDAIGSNLGQRLAEHYTVRYYDWDDPRAIHPAPGDILLGHPHPNPWTIFRRSLALPGWQRILAIGPFSHADPRYCAFLDSFVARCHLYLAITGRYWFETVSQSIFAHWYPKMVHLDLAVDRRDFPPIKIRFNPPGQRRFVYVGHSGWTKNTGYLSEIARLMPETQVNWVGGGGRRIAGVTALGSQDFTTEQSRQLLASHDFLIIVSKADANPVTILEAMACGLIPVCTPQCGYTGYPGIINIPLGDAPKAVETLRRLQAMPEAELQSLQASNWQILDEYFTWDRFALQVKDAIESEEMPALLPVSLHQRLRIVRAELVSPLFFLRPVNALRYVYRSAQTVIPDPKR